MEKLVENNQVTIIGEIISGFTFSHEVFGEGFYVVEVAVKRLSGQVDVIPLMISDRLIDVSGDYCGRTVEAAGQFRSHNRQEGTRNRLLLSVFVREIVFKDDFTYYTNINKISLDGYICKVPTYRKTPFGRKIADLFLAVNRPYGKSDYIPCIAWGRNASYVSGLPMGTALHVWGRIQSREYTKQVSETERKSRVVHEVSVSGLELGNACCPYRGELKN